MKIAFTGTHGFIATSLRKAWQPLGFEFLSLNRNEPESVWLRKLQESDVVINLAGAPVTMRWTPSNKELIRKSRIQTTRKLIGLINQMPESKVPKLFISGSAIGIYPNHGRELCTEQTSEIGSNFLARVVAEWEQEALGLSNPNVRLVIARTGVVLGLNGGMLPRLLPLFKWGLGGKIGSGKQRMPFIHIDDVVSIFRFFIENQSTSGVYNLVAPNATTNEHFTCELAKSLNRSAPFAIPSFVLKLVFGSMSELLTKGEFVYPERLLTEGYSFKFPEVEAAVQHLVSASR
jgi:uncharacterized protein